MGYGEFRFLYHIVYIYTYFFFVDIYFTSVDIFFTGPLDFFFFFPFFCVSLELVD